MALFRKRKDPLDVRSRELADEIKRLEREIRTLGKAPAPTPSVGHNGHPSPSSHVPATPPRAPVAPLPRQASIALPAREGFPRPAQTGPRQPHGRDADNRSADPLASPVGARKFDLPAAWRRWSARFASNADDSHRMAHYLASGSFQGLRPLRYEKRVARNRFIGLFILLVIVLTGLARVYVVSMK